MRSSTEPIGGLRLAIKKAGTALRVLRESGAAAVGAVARDKLMQLSRRRPGGLARIDGCRFRVDNLLEVIRTDLLRNIYEKEEREAIKLFLDRSLPVIELGGSIGVVACITNKKLKDRHQHVVVEADPEIFPKLQFNRDLNGCGFEVLNRALAYDSEEVLFKKGLDSLGGGVYVQGLAEFTVKTVTLEMLARDRGMNRFTLVCDIEGSEIDLVQHEVGLLATAVDTIIVETHPKITGTAPITTMLAALKNAGFKTVFEKTGTLVLKNTRSWA